jgi:hypothetical protein
VTSFAHAGVTDLRCVLPDAAEIHDVLAQVTAVTVGTADKLVPGDAWQGRRPAPGTGG